MTTKVILPAGTYRIGDPCYSIPDELWGDFCEILFQHNTILITEFKGFPLVAFDTVHGDGGYYDEAGRGYPVDAGMLGAIPVEFPNLKMLENYFYNHAFVPWYEVTFAEDFECYSSHGKIYFGDIVIDTDPETEYDDWDSSWDIQSEHLDDEEGEDD